MAARSTQVGVEVLLTPDARRARVTQFGIELLLPNEAVAPEPTGAAAQRWSRRWDGAAWVPATAKRWTGTSWV